MHSEYHTPHAPQRGMTMVELMIAMALGLILVGTIGMAYVSAKASFRSQSAMSRVQENARYAFEYLAADVRMAGFIGSIQDTALSIPAAWGSPPHHLRRLKDLPLRGYENDASLTDPFPAEVTAASRLAGTDALTVVYIDTGTDYTLDAGTPYSGGTFTLDGVTAPDVGGGVYACMELNKVTLFAKNGTDTASIGVTEADSQSNITCAAGAYCKVHPLKATAYFIRNNASNEPSLYRISLGNDGNAGAAEELVEGVSDMEITYGVDTDGNESIDAYQSADTVATGNNWPNVLSVRITLTFTTRQNERVSTTGTQATKSFTTVFAIRNRL